MDHPFKLTERAVQEHVHGKPGDGRSIHNISRYLRETSAMYPDFFRDAREELCLTQVELGFVFGITPETISRWENGRTEPSSIVTQMLLCRYVFEQRQGINHSFLWAVYWSVRPDKDPEVLLRPLSAAEEEELFEQTRKLWAAKRQELAKKG